MAQPLPDQLRRNLLTTCPLVGAIDGRSGEGTSSLGLAVMDAPGTTETSSPWVAVIEGDQFSAGGRADLVLGA